jgi:hypothetical protein
LAPEVLKQEGKMPEKLKTNYINHISNAVKDLKGTEADFRRSVGWKFNERG